MSLSPVIQKSSVHSRSYFAQGAASPFLPVFPKSLCLSIAALQSDELSHQVSVILMTPKSSDCMCTSSLSSLLPVQHIFVYTSIGLQLGFQSCCFLRGRERNIHCLVPCVLPWASRFWPASLTNLVWSSSCQVNKPVALFSQADPMSPLLPLFLEDDPVVKEVKALLPSTSCLVKCCSAGI